VFSKILVCLDGSVGALTAARMGAQIAQKFHSAVLLVHTDDPAIAVYPEFGGGGWEFSPSREGIDSETEETWRNLAEHTGKILREAGLKYETLLECGHPVGEITRVAKQHKVDLIVLGGRGVGDLQNALLGSVSESVLHRAHCPVLTVRGDPPTSLQHILLAADGSEGAGQAAGAAIRIAQKFAASLRVLNVLDAASLPSSFSLYPCAESQTPYARAELLLEKITKDVRAEASKAGVPRTFHQETGNPAEIIVAFANRQKADLIVLGCRGRGAFKSLLLGSVSNRVVHETHCSVLVMR